MFFSDVPVVGKIWFVRAHFDLWHSLVCPIATGFCIAIAIPFITAFGAWAASVPKFWLFKIQRVQVRRQEVEQLRIDGERETLLAQKRERDELEKIKDAEREQRASKVSSQLQNEIL